MKHSISLITTFALGAIIFGAASILLAWTGPTQTAPGGNVSPPINTGSTAQIKAGAFGIKSVSPLVFDFEVNGSTLLNSIVTIAGDTLMSGATRYLNFGSTAGSAGYGIRNNSGSMEFKNSGAAGWSSIGSGGTLSAVRSYTSSATWSKPTNVSYIVVEVWGGGGAGGDGDNSGDGTGGGGAGGYSLKRISAASLGATETITVGAGGIVTASAAGGPGGTTSFGTHLSATGGTGGARSGGNTLGGIGGVGSGGDLNLKGGDGDASAVPIGGMGGSAPRGGGGGGSTSGCNGLTAEAGGVFGGGGGGGCGVGGVGGSGGVVIYEYTI